MVEYLDGKLEYISKSADILTPIDAAQNIIDLIPEEIWSNKDTKLIDIATKSGIFLKLAHDRYMQGLDGVIEDKDERSKFIWDNQLYGIATTKSTALIVRMELYNDYMKKGNIIRIDNYTTKLKEHKIVDIIEEYGKGMKFDVVIGNPPYQEQTGGGRDGGMTMPLYHRFIESALELKPKYISMIIPSRWMSGGKSVLDSFRRKMLEDRHIRTLINYQKASDIFDGVDIAGGVQYFLWDSQYTGETKVINRVKNKKDIVETRDISKYTYTNAHDKVQYMVIVDNTSAKIADRVINFGEVRMDDTVIQIRPFGLGSDFEDNIIQNETDNIKVICSNSRETWTSLSEITQNRDVVGKWKVCTGKVTSEHGATPIDGSLMNVITKPFIAKPNEVCSMTYLVLAVFNTEAEAKNCMAYVKTKFARFLMSITLSGMNMTSRNYMFVPVQDYSKTWTDTELYKKYNLTQDEIDYIEKTVKAMT